VSTALKLVAFDTDRIKEYVFATDALREIRGASARLDQLNRRIMPYLVRRADPGMQRIYAHGGAGLFVVDTDRADRARLAVERAYRKYTGGAASVTGVTLDLSNGFNTQNDNVQNLFRLLQIRLRQAKDSPPPAVAAASLSHLRPCDACAEFPAMVWVQEHGEARLLCNACRLRRRSMRGLWERLSQRGVPQGELPEDFNALSEFSRPKGYMGLLYADGNGMGREIERAGTLNALADFAVAVDSAVHQAACDAICGHLQPVNGILPCIPLLLGGDDLVMVTRAQSAINVAITLVERFGEITASEIGRPLSLSVGVVLAHANFPFRAMLDIAESALKFAKREAARRQLGDRNRSLINFLTITSANHLDFKRYYAETLQHQPDLQGPKWLRSLRPYTPTDLRNLLEVARALRDAPRSKLHALGECVFLSHGQSILEGLTTLMRWRGGAQEGRRAEQVRDVRRLVDQSGAGTPIFPWNGNAREWRTPLLDLVELFDFVKDG
jgi:hypothetical protein